MNRWQTCKGRRQSKKLKSEPLPSIERELLTMGRPKMKAAMGLLTGRTVLRLVCLTFRRLMSTIVDVPYR
jgi:hypothetical protein